MARAWRRSDARDAVYTVTELSREIRFLFETQFDRISVRGEITGLSRPGSGHLYFSLVDDALAAGKSRFTTAQIPVVVWRSSAARLRFDLENGAKVICTGRLGVYEPRGTYQLIADRVVPDGIGELQLAFEQLKRKLEAEGLFDADRKRPLPFLPRRIGLVTSPTGAAIRDFLRILLRRFPGAWVRVAPVRVQGDGAAEEIAAAIARLGGPEPEVDVVVVTRGGGSLEDLWAFNEERVARAIAASSVPVVSAVGHEVDFTIADFVADHRAATPTAAAEGVVPSLADLREVLQRSSRRLRLALQGRLDRARDRLERCAGRAVLRAPDRLVDAWAQPLDRLADALRIALYNRSTTWNHDLRVFAARLDGLSPLRILARGYSVTLGPDGQVVRRASDVRPGDLVEIRLDRGRLGARVRDVEDPDGSPRSPGDAAGPGARAS